jgi:hypothetical protein
LHELTRAAMKCTAEELAERAIEETRRERTTQEVTEGTVKASNTRDERDGQRGRLPGVDRSSVFRLSPTRHCKTACTLNIAFHTSSISSNKER